MKKVMTMRIIGVLLIVLAYSIPAFAHEPNPAQDFYCGNQFVTFFVVGTVEDDDDDESPLAAHLVTTVRKSDVQWITLDHIGAEISVCDSSFGEDLCLRDIYRVPTAFYRLIVECLG